MKTSVVTTFRIGAAVALALAQSGCTNVLGFGTATKFGLDISQRTDQTIDVSLGYDRAEIASIPAPKKLDATFDKEGNPLSDTYSVLGTFKVTYDNPFTNRPLVLDQLFATGGAARAAAQNPEMQRFFGGRVHEIAMKKPAEAAMAAEAESAQPTGDKK